MNRIVVVIWAVTMLVGCADSDGDATRSAPEPSSAAPRSSATDNGRSPTPDDSSTSPNTAAGSTTGSTEAPHASAQPPTSDAAHQSDPATATLDDDIDQIGDVGVSFELPPGWERSGAAVATEFAADADCTAATIVDFEPPTDPAAEGEAGFTLRSTVQVCSRPVDGRSLGEFIDDTYGDRFEFEPVELGGLDGYRSRSGRDTIVFVQSASKRFQVLTSVAADPTLEGERLAAVADIIDTMTFE